MEAFIAQNDSAYMHLMHRRKAVWGSMRMPPHDVANCAHMLHCTLVPTYQRRYAVFRTGLSAAEAADEGHLQDSLCSRAVVSQPLLL